MTDEQFREVARLAATPPPAIAAASQDEIRQLIAFLAATLKTPRGSTDTNRVKLGAYRLALTGLQKPSIDFAVQTAIRTMEWLPTPSELLKLARDYTAPEVVLHSRARRLVRDRQARTFELTLLKCRRRELSLNELQEMSDHCANVAQDRGFIIIRRSGERVYRTKDNLEADRLERREIALALANERDKRAEDTHSVDGNRASRSEIASSLTGEPKTVERAERASQGNLGHSEKPAVGDIAAGIVAGMELDDGEV